MAKLNLNFFNKFLLKISISIGTYATVVAKWGALKLKRLLDKANN
jgi:hypothetical protein